MVSQKEIVVVISVSVVISAIVACFLLPIILRQSHALELDNRGELKNSKRVIARLIDHWTEKVKSGKSTKNFDHMVVAYLDENRQMQTIDTFHSNSVIMNTNQYFSDIPSFPDSYAIKDWEALVSEYNLPEPIPRPEIAVYQTSPVLADKTHVYLYLYTRADTGEKIVFVVPTGSSTYHCVFGGYFVVLAVILCIVFTQNSAPLNLNPKLSPKYGPGWRELAPSNLTSLAYGKICLASTLPLAPILVAIFCHAWLDNLFMLSLFFGSCVVLGVYSVIVIFGIYNILLYYAISEPVMLIRSDDFSKKGEKGYWKLKRGQSAEVKVIHHIYKKLPLIQAALEFKGAKTVYTKSGGKTKTETKYLCLAKVVEKIEAEYLRGDTLETTFYIRLPTSLQDCYRFYFHYNLDILRYPDSSASFNIEY